jgi:hypothetical protein
MSLIIDSKKLRSRNPSDIVLYLKDENLSRYNAVNLETIILKHSDRIVRRHTQKYIGYVHCSILNKDDNILNGERSDIIGIFPVNSPKKYFYYKFPNTVKNITSNDVTSIRMTLKGEDDLIVNEIEQVVYEMVLTSK